MSQDLWKFGSLIVVSGLIGWYFDQPLLAMLITSIGIIVWQVYRLDLLYLWIINRKKNPYPDTHGQFYLLHRTINKINIKNSARKRRLTKYLKQFRKAASALPNAVVLIDPAGKITWANDNAQAIFGIDWRSDIGVRFTDLIRDPKVEKLLKKKNKLSETEINSQLNDDSTISVQVVNYTDDQRMVIGRDISRLVKVNQIQSDFVANVSHELKTPLTVLKGYLEILQNNPNLNQELEKPLAQMAMQSERMEYIVQDLLYLAKLENKDDQTQHETVDITNIINTIVETISDRVADKQLKLELDIDYSVSVIGSHTELHAAFSNLIFNAVNYTPKQGIIKVSWQSHVDGASFSVKDNGDGIPEQHLTRLTQRFYRIDNDRSREGGGTGLGLAIVKHVLQRHQAKLEIESKIGKGSEFKCVFTANHIVKSKLKEIVS